MRILGVIFLLINAFWVEAQSVFTGKVLDAETGEPLVGANIYSLSNFAMGTITDVDGVFALEKESFSEGDVLLISFIGYKELKRSIGKLTSTIKLIPKAYHISEVNVVAEPIISEEFQLLSIKKLDIYKNPAAKADPLLAVNSLPSSTTTDESAAVSLRGSSPIETGIFLNGVPIYDVTKYAQLNGIGTFSLFNTSLVKSVSVFPGNPPLEFGNTTSGVVAIESDDTPIKDSYNELIISPASFGYQLNQGIKRGGLKTFVNYQPSALVKSMNRDALEDIEQFQSTDAGIYFFCSPTDNLSLRTYNYGLLENYLYHFKHPSFQGHFDQDRKRAFNVTNLSLVLGAGTLSWNQGFSISKSNYAYSISAIEAIDRSLFQGVNYFYQDEHLQVKTGLSHDVRASEVDGAFFEKAYALGEYHPIFQFNDRELRGVTEAYVYTKYYLQEQWIIGGGLRKNLRFLSNENYLSKQFNMTYLVNENLRVLAGIGNYHKEAILINTTQSAFLASEQVSLDVLYEKKRTESSVSLFHKSVSRKNQREISGAELYFRTVFIDQLDFDVSYTHIITEGDQESSLYDIGYFFRSNLSFRPSPLFSLTIGGIFRQGINYQPVVQSQYDESFEVYQPIYSESYDRYPDYFILNMAASRSFTISDDIGLVAFLSVNNLTNHENIRTFEYNTDYSETIPSLLSRRMVYFGSQISF